MEKYIEQKINDAMSSLSGMERAAAPAYFFGRIEAKMQQHPLGILEKLYYWISRPSIAFAGLCLILFINTTILVWTNNFKTNEQPELASVDEYNLVSSTYEIENITP